MKSKKKLLKSSRLYLIIDKMVCAGKPMDAIALAAAEAGADIIQLRDKESPKEIILQSALRIRKSLAAKKSLFIINDYPEIARLADADGVHLGQADYPLEIARKILGRDKIIGVSCTDLKQAQSAQEQGADYLGIGPVFKTSTKETAQAAGTGLISEAARNLRIPFFALGGINGDNLSLVISAGARRIALCGAICRENDIASATRKIRRLLN
ncbi:MAG: thiamine phosphate synthase [Deltaproteobacteria bacterium]